MGSFSGGSGSAKRTARILVFCAVVFVCFGSVDGSREFDCRKQSNSLVFEERFEERIPKQKFSRSDFHFQAEKFCLRGFEAPELEIVQFMSSLMNLVSIFVFTSGLFVDFFEGEKYQASKQVRNSAFRRHDLR